MELVPTQLSANGGGVDLRAALGFLGEQGFNTVLCEGGASVAASLLSEHFVDEVYWIVSPKILGDVEAKPGIAFPHFVDLDDAQALTKMEFVRLGDDMLIHGFLSK